MWLLPPASVPCPVLRTTDGTSAPFLLPAGNIISMAFSSWQNEMGIKRLGGLGSRKHKVQVKIWGRRRE